jgi:predicted nucleotide-binding protein
MFIVHGKDVTPLEQLKKILLEFKIPFKVAVDEPHVGRPISPKVSELMKSCTSAIIIFTTDEEYADTKGNKFYIPSDNAVYELGAASILYGDKIVILKEEGVSLPSDFSDLGHITFKKDELDAKSMQLIKELIGFGLLKFTTA